MNGKEEGRLCLFTSPTPRSCHAMPMKNPPHPGRSIRTACLEPLGLSVTEGAEVLGSHPANPQQRHPLASRGSAPRWRFGSPRPLAARPKRGYGCSLSMISHRPEKTRAKSRSAVSMCSRNCTHSDSCAPVGVLSSSSLGKAQGWPTRPNLLFKISREDPASGRWRD
jgi:hypothetical protein